jgi:hypothetical protein
MGTMAGFEMRYDLPVCFCPTAEAAARQVERWAFYFARECVAAVNGLRRATGD